MRFFVGDFPVDEDFDPDEESAWVKMDEPSPTVAIWVISVPIGIVLGVLSYLAVKNFTSINDVGMGFFAVVVAYIVMIVLHELIHAFAHPEFGYSDRSVVGYWDKQGVFLAMYLGEMSRDRFLAILIMPFLVLTIGLLFLAASIEVQAWFVGFVIVVNAFSACADILGFFLVATRVPRGSVVRNKGYYTYWRHPQCDTPS